MSKGTLLFSKPTIVPALDCEGGLSVCRPSFRRRFVAAWSYDYLFSMWLATISLAGLKLVIGFNPTLPVPFLFCVFLVFLLRDSLPGGISPGKNLLGLEIVDKLTGKRVTLRQSILRNLVLLAPYFAYFLAALLLGGCEFAPDVLSALKTVGTVYISIMLIVEGGLMIFCGERLADKLSGTTVRWRLHKPCSDQGSAESEV